MHKLSPQDVAQGANEELELERRLSLPDVCRLTSLSAPAIERRVRLGQFPKPLKDGRRNVWPARWVLNYLRGQYPGSQE